MKIALVTDTHWGNRNDATILLDHQRDFFATEFFPVLKERGISTIIHLGDLVDRRKYINFQTAQRLKTDFLDPCEDYELHIMAGNHDVFYKQTNRINVYDQLNLMSSYTNVHMYINEPQEFTFGNRKCLMVPWINDENKDVSFSKIENTDADYVFGHLEISGFEMYRGAICETGVDKNLFDKFTAVYSGHFHQKSTRGNITYLGAPFHMTWGDYPSLRGFHIWDPETNELEFIENKKSLFSILYYDGDDSTVLAEQNLTGSYVKVIVNSKKDPYLFDKYIAEIEKQEPHDLRIIESYSFEESRDEIIGEAEDTQTIITNTIDSLDITCNKKDLKSLMNDLYNEAINMERAE